MSYFYCESCHGIIKSDSKEDFIDCGFCGPMRGPSGSPYKMGRCDLAILRAKGIASKTYYCYCYDCELLCHPSKEQHKVSIECPKASFYKSGHKAIPIDLTTLRARHSECSDDSDANKVHEQIRILEQADLN